MSNNKYCMTNGVGRNQGASIHYFQAPRRKPTCSLRSDNKNKFRLYLGRRMPRGRRVSLADKN